MEDFFVCIYINDMFKDIQSGLSKFFGRKWIPIVVIIAICLILLGYSTSKSSWSDGYTNQSQMGVGGPVAPAAQVQVQQAQAVAQASAPSGQFLSTVANPADLLPSDANSQWGGLNPINGVNIQTPDLLQAGYHIGLDTIGQTLKNANLQLRSDPLIEKRDVGPWNMSTYEPDIGRVPLEIGACSK